MPSDTSHTTILWTLSAPNPACGTAVTPGLVNPRGVPTPPADETTDLQPSTCPILFCTQRMVPLPSGASTTLGPYGNVEAVFWMPQPSVFQPVLARYRHP